MRVARQAIRPVTGRLGPRIAYRFGAPEIEIVPADGISSAGYHSQLGQDLFLDRHVFGGSTGGVFVDVGAHDGVTLSNTYFFEQRRGWGGVCIEPNPLVFEKLQLARSAHCVNAAVGTTTGTLPFRMITGEAEMLSGLESAYNRRHRRRIERDVSRSGGEYHVEQVAVRRLDSILTELGIDHVDLLSIDVEGGEAGVLDSIKLSTFGVAAVMVENNYGSWSIAGRMKRQGYQLIARLGWDELYMPSPLCLTSLR